VDVALADALALPLSLGAVGTLGAPASAVAVHNTCTLLLSNPETLTQLTYTACVDGLAPELKAMK
jgi:hypothetical protein